MARYKCRLLTYLLSGATGALQQIQDNLLQTFAKCMRFGWWQTGGRFFDSLYMYVNAGPRLVLWYKRSAKGDTGHHGTGHIEQQGHIPVLLRYWHQQRDIGGRWADSRDTFLRINLSNTSTSAGCTFLLALRTDRLADIYCCLCVSRLVFRDFWRMCLLRCTLDFVRITLYLCRVFVMTVLVRGALIKSLSFIADYWLILYYAFVLYYFVLWQLKQEI